MTQPTRTLACNAPYGSGGLGRHLAELVEYWRDRHDLCRYYTTVVPAEDPAGQEMGVPFLSPLFRYTPLRFSPGWQNHLNGDWFDRAVARQLQPGHTLVGFNGQALHSFRRATQLGYERLELLSANSHTCHVAHQHQLALHTYPIEGSWLNGAQQQKTIQEYEQCDRIYVASEYTRQSFLRQGIAAEKLQRFFFRPAARFQPTASLPPDRPFRIVYTGSLTVMKGIPVLLEAFSRLSEAAELTLVGNSGTRGMRRYLQGWLRRDRRIRIAPGDPLPHLQAAHVYVHPSYEDGLAYAPLEALACGVPVIVTEDTGMKDYVQPGENGFVVPTGSWEAILNRLEWVQQHPLRRSLCLLNSRPQGEHFHETSSL